MRAITALPCSARNARVFARLERGDEQRVVRAQRRPLGRRVGRMRTEQGHDRRAQNAGHVHRPRAGNGQRRLLCERGGQLGKLQIGEETDPARKLVPAAGRESSPAAVAPTRCR